MSRRRTLEKHMPEYAEGAYAFRGRKTLIEEYPVQISNRYLKARTLVLDADGLPTLTDDKRDVVWTKPRRIRIPKQCRLMRNARLSNG